MAISLASERVAPSIRRPLATRWAALAILFAAEGAALSLRFSTPRLAGDLRWWAAPLARTHELAFPSFLATATIAALGAARSWSSGRGEAGWSGLARGLVAHLLAMAAFVALTLRVCEGDALGGRWAAAWALGWYAAGLAVLITWLAALRPADAPLAADRHGLAIALAGLAVGATAFAVARLSADLWVPLAGGTLVLVRLMLGLVASDVVCDPASYLVGVERFAVRIAPACSGYEGMGMVGAFLAAYLAGSRRSLRWPNAWLLVPIGVAAIWLANAVRIVALVLIGAHVSPEVALGGFHSQAGSLGFLAISLGLVVASRLSRFFMADRTRPGAELGTANPTAAYLMPFLAIVATTMCTGAISSTGFDALYPARIIAGGALLWYFRRQVPGRPFDGSWLAVAAGLGVFALWVALEPANPSGARALGSGYAGLPAAWGWAWLAARVAGSVVVVPLAEELAFRGYLTRRLIAADFEAVPPGRFTWLSFLLSSLAFGSLHGRWLAGTLAGLAYAGVYYRRGRVGEAALAHAVTNGCIAAAVLATGDWSYWS